MQGFHILRVKMYLFFHSLSQFTVNVTCLDRMHFWSATALAESGRGRKGTFSFGQGMVSLMAAAEPKPKQNLSEKNSSL